MTLERQPLRGRGGASSSFGAHLGALGALALAATVGCSEPRATESASAGKSRSDAAAAEKRADAPARAAADARSLTGGQATPRLVSTTSEAATPAPTSPAAKAVHWVDDYEKALELAEKHDELVLVDFYTDWCGWCKKLDRDVFSKDEWSKAASGVIAVKVNAEKDRPLAQQFGATSYPRLFFLDSEGKVLEQIRGYLTLEKFTAKVTEVKEGNTEYSRYRDAAADPSNLGAVRQFARFLADTGRSEESIPYWQQVHDESLQRLFANPNVGGLETFHRESLLELGQAYFAVGLTDVGRQHLDEVQTSYPGSNEAATAMVALAELHVKNGDLASAKQMLERVVTETPRAQAARDARQLLPRVQAALAR